MTVKEKLGQLMMFGFPGTEPDDATLTLIKEYKAANIILFAHNIVSSEQLCALCQKLQQLVFDSTGTRAIISIDQEGGVVARLPEDAVSFPSAMAIAATQNEQNADISAYFTARELAALGVNCNLAPVMDINTNVQNPVIGVRSYGCTPQEVTPFALNAVKGTLRAGIMPVIKHFPGHGDTNVDSHLGLPKIEKSLDELMECELVPFIKAINDGAPAVMAAHILFPSIDSSSMPASMSYDILTGLLRKKLGFKGLIVSDCFEMGAVQDHYGTANGFVQALRAGLDLGCVSHSPALAIQALELAEKAVLNETLSMQRVDEALENVLIAKQRFANVDASFCEIGSDEKVQAAKRIMKQAITRLDNNEDLPIVNENSFFAGCPAYRATFASSVVDDGKTFSQNMASRFNAKFEVTSVNPSQQEIQLIIDKTYQGQTVVVGTYNAHLNIGQINLVNQLCLSNRLVIAVALRNPFDLPLMSKGVFKLAAFEYTNLSFDAIEDVLRGEKATGKLDLPVQK